MMGSRFRFLIHVSMCLVFMVSFSLPRTVQAQAEFRELSRQQVARHLGTVLRSNLFETYSRILHDGGTTFQTGLAKGFLDAQDNVWIIIQSKKKDDIAMFQVVGSQVNTSTLMRSTAQPDGQGYLLEIYQEETIHGAVEMDVDRTEIKGGWLLRGTTVVEVERMKIKDSVEAASWVTCFFSCWGNHPLTGFLSFIGVAAHFACMFPVDGGSACFSLTATLGLVSLIISMDCAYMCSGVYGMVYGKEGEAA